MKKTEIVELIKILKDTYPNATCSLDFSNPFELVVAVMLSAQCTDERVNLTTPYLFSKYPTPEAICDATIEDIEQIIHPCGFYKNKAKNLKLCAEKLVKNYNSIVPKSIEALTSLAGIGRKSANVIRLEVFNIADGIAIDTHAKRISNRVGLSSQNDPLKIEQDLIKIIPKQYIKDINHLFVYHGRAVCTARNPKCTSCPIKKLCNFNKC